METLGRWWKKVPVAIRKPLVFMVGAAIIAAGVAMLILPGPANLNCWWARCSVPGNIGEKSHSSRLA
jgi:hypothetical protein